MTLVSLYRRVTEAILRAESLDDGTAEAAAVHLEVSQLEEQIAREFPPSHPEGAIARRGAVRAAVAARHYARAEHLAEQYIAEAEAPPDLARTLRELATAVRTEETKFSAPETTQRSSRDRPASMSTPLEHARDQPRFWKPWEAMTEAPGDACDPVLEAALRQLSTYVAPEALRDVDWDEDGGDAPAEGAARDEGTLVVRLYERLARQRIDFWPEPRLAGDSTQDIRHPWLLVHGRAGTSLDFATTFAASCLDAGIPPLLVVTRDRCKRQNALVVVTPDREPGHTGFEQHWTTRLTGFEGVFEPSAAIGVVRIRNSPALKRALADRRLLAVDFDRAPSESAVPFDEAGRRAREHLHRVLGDGGGVWGVDVAFIQGQGLTALPAPLTRAPIRRFIPGGRARFHAYHSRAAIMSALSEAQDTVVLIGDSGSGKSTIARATAYAAPFGAAWFLTASDLQALVTCLCQAEQAELGLRLESLAQADRAGFASGALARLSETEDGWVVVVDNADGDPGHLLPFLPHPNPRRPPGVRQLVLITTTNPSWQESSYRVLRLAPVDVKEAIDCLPGSELAAVAGGRPLLFDAFNRIAATTGWDAARIAAYCPAPGSLPERLLGPATLWAAARAADGFNEGTLTVGGVAAYLPPDRQPLAAAAALEPSFDSSAALRLLIDLGLLSASLDDDAVRMHRLVGAAIRADLEVTEPALVDDIVKLLATSEQAIQLLDRDGDLATVAQLVDRLELIDARTPEPNGELGRAMHGVAELLEMHGHTRRSGDVYGKAQRHLRGDDRRLGVGLHGRARTVNQHHAHDDAQLREALDWARTAESMLRDGGESDRADRCLAMQGLIMQKLARFPRVGETHLGLLHEALDVIERADRLRSARLAAGDPDNPELLRSRFNCAGIRISLAQADPEHAAGHLDVALAVYQSVEQARRRIYGRDQHPHIAACVIGRAYVAYYRAALVEAARLERTAWLREATDRTIEALGIREMHDGDIDHDETAKCVRFLAKVCHAREALRLGVPHDHDAEFAPLRGAVPMNVTPPDPAVMARDAIASQAATKSVFLCHSSTDKPAVRALCHRLQRDGLSVWLDEESLLPGQRWEGAIEAAVSSAACVVVCLSAAATTRSGYVHKEIGYALDIADRQPEDAIFVIPARLEACDVPRRLDHLHRVDLFDQMGYDRLVGVLQAAIETASA